ncbi:MAG: glycosyltransferase family A protein, partial [Elusimicrobiota bacterium]|nr:glycosyltransferase family A protein [Elusimicrobiota bacterium]
MQNGKFFTIIIPTYNRKNVLRKCLNALSNQVCKSDFEVIIIDDGSTDGTEDFVKQLISITPYYVRYFRQKNKGPAAARNVGIKNATGEIILFMGDDIIADSNLLYEHLSWHIKFSDNNIGVLGY